MCSSLEGSNVVNNMDYKVNLKSVKEIIIIIGLENVIVIFCKNWLFFVFVLRLWLKINWEVFN